jgi:4-hydroxymandelate oxidase
VPGDAAASGLPPEGLMVGDVLLGHALLGDAYVGDAVTGDAAPDDDPAARLGDTVSLADVEERARRRMSHMAYEYVASGAADEVTLRWNREAFDRIRLRPRVLRDVAAVDTRVTLFGREHALPLLLAPTAYHRVLHPDAELATARGAGAAGVTWVVSTSTNTAVEDVARAATAPLWFQLYVQPDRALTRDTVERAQAAGCEALCLTVDTPVLGPRDRQARAGFVLPPGTPTPHLEDATSGRRPIMATPGRVAVTWKDVEWLLAAARVPVLLKGILDPDDAERALDAGAHGVIVSNHGARNLDTAPATIDALPAVAARVAGRAPVLVDGGVRRGTDVVKALALGASAVLVGRPYCYGLALGGPAGVARVVEILRRELEMAMMLLGVASARAIDRGVLWDG